MSAKTKAKPTAETNPAFASVEENCWFYAAARAELRTVMTTMQDEIRAIGEQYRDRLQAALDQAVNARALLESTVRRDAALFDEPRTRQFHGVKVGFRKQPIKVAVDDEGIVIQRVREKLPELEKALIKKTESVRKDALIALDKTQLDALGVARIDGEDDLVLKAADTDLDKLIKALSADDTMTEDMVTKAGAI